MHKRGRRDDGVVDRLRIRHMQSRCVPSDRQIERQNSTLECRDDLPL
jgi:hypothetical protein